MMKKEITLRQATPQDTDTVTDLALLLWPGHGREALRQEMEAFCTREMPPLSSPPRTACPWGSPPVPCGGNTSRGRNNPRQATSKGFLSLRHSGGAARRPGCCGAVKRGPKKKDVRSSPATVSWKTRKAGCSMPHAAFRKSAEPSISPSGLPRLGCKKPSRKRGGP